MTLSRLFILAFIFPSFIFATSYDNFRGHIFTLGINVTLSIICSIILGLLFSFPHPWLSDDAFKKGFRKNRFFIIAILSLPLTFRTLIWFFPFQQ